MFNEDNEPETTHEEYEEYNYDNREINGDELELITDLDEFENYNRQENINDEFFNEENEQEINDEEYEENDYDTEELKGDDLELITDPNEDENYNHYEKSDVETFSENNEQETAHEEYEEYDYDTEEIKGGDLELITDPNEDENYNQYENINTDLSRDNDQEEYEQFEAPIFDKLNEQTYKEQIQEQITEANQTENEKLSEEIYATENDKDTEIKLKEIVEDIINRAQLQHNEISSEDRDIINSEDDTLYSGNKRNSSYQSSISRLSSEPFTFQISAEQTETYYQEDQQEQDNQDGENKKTPDNESKKKKEENKKQDQDTTNKKSNGNSSKAEKKIPINLPELYRKETNGRPFYARKKTEGFKRWLQQREQEKTKKEKKTNEANEEWEKLLKKWIDEADEADISIELKERLHKILNKYSKIRRTFPQINLFLKKLKQKNITQSEIKNLQKLAKQFEKISPVEKGLFENLYYFAQFYEKNNIWYQNRIEEQREKFNRHLVQKLEKLNKENDTHERKEEWVDVLLNHIQTILDEEISQDTKEELTYIIKNYDKLQQTSKNLPPPLKQIIEELEQFQATYNEYKQRGYEKSIPLEVSRVAKKLRKSLELFKNETILTAILNKKDLSLQNFKENLYKSTTLRINEKSKIIKIIQKEKLMEEDKDVLISILSKYPTKDLKSLLGNDFHSLILRKDIQKSKLMNLVLTNQYKDARVSRSRLSEESLREKARIWNLALLSDYKSEYKNRNSILRWKCNECGHKFFDSVGNLRVYKFPCPECRKRKRERKTLFYDNVKGIKECGSCHRILPFSNFYKRGGTRGKKEGHKKFHSSCKSCYNTYQKIKRYRNKFKLINEFFSGKCHKCSQDLNFLSIAHFHHTDPQFKTKEWKNVEDKSYTNILKWAHRDKIIPLCNNCHKKEGAPLFNKFKDLILKQDLFSMSAEQIDQLLIVGKGMTSDEKTKIQKWIRKRYIIEKVFGGKCI